MPCDSFVATTFLVLCCAGPHTTNGFPSAPAPGLFGRSTPNGLGSWRVESVLDTQKPNSMFVFLFDDGSVHTAVSGTDGKDDHAGRWRVRGNEFSLTVNRKSQSRFLDDLKYVGVLKKFSSVVEGSVIEGQMDPAVVGKFKMTPVESSMASDLKKAAEANDSAKYVAPKYSKAAIAGDWVLMWQDTGAVFRLHLGEDLQFESLKGLGSGQLGGRWNLWGTERMFMTVVRSKSHGVQMHGDHMFWGTKLEGPPDSKIPLKISGYVMYGFLEPTCVGRFIMRRSQEGRTSDEDTSGILT
ncbi:expressed unknown protein [Ectocarpus siliculosus]|uniref:Uncharacterized protein n=1 Tax=Ectocarpus siliculosus TaxID=2880 RepID=D7FNR2_ECTSI|nr:expressed unknown protein [Ectocarpus siliculosus]|eukprot:CBJ26073.1 expressed unknown protein [Ectocarpus siliculosus]